MQGSETRLERVPIAANLRHDQLDAYHRGLAEDPARRAGRPEPAPLRAPNWPSCSGWRSS